MSAGRLLTRGFGTPFGGRRYIFTRGLASSAVTAVYPAPADVRLGVTYGPNGNDYTGTLVAGGGAFMLRRR